MATSARYAIEEILRQTKDMCVDGIYNLDAIPHAEPERVYYGSPARSALALSFTKTEEATAPQVNVIGNRYRWDRRNMVPVVDGNTVVYVVSLSEHEVGVDDYFAQYDYLKSNFEFVEEKLYLNGELISRQDPRAGSIAGGDISPKIQLYFFLQDEDYNYQQARRAGGGGNTIYDDGTRRADTWFEQAYTLEVCFPTEEVSRENPRSPITTRKITPQALIDYAMPKSVKFSMHNRALSQRLMDVIETGIVQLVETQLVPALEREFADQDLANIRFNYNGRRFDSIRKAWSEKYGNPDDASARVMNFGGRRVACYAPRNLPPFYNNDPISRKVVEDAIMNQTFLTIANLGGYYYNDGLHTDLENIVIWGEYYDRDVPRVRLDMENPDAFLVERPNAIVCTFDDPVHGAMEVYLNWFAWGTNDYRNAHLRCIVDSNMPREAHQLARMEDALTRTGLSGYTYRNWRQELALVVMGGEHVFMEQLQERLREPFLNVPRPTEVTEYDLPRHDARILWIPNGKRIEWSSQS